MSLEVHLGGPLVYRATFHLGDLAHPPDIVPIIGMFLNVVQIS